MFIDSHAHYDLKHFDDTRWQLLAACKTNNIGKIIIPAITIESNTSMMEALDYNRFPQLLDNVHNSVQQEDLPSLYFAVGLHPTRLWAGTDQDDPAWLQQIRQAAAQPRVVAIGETGLDNHHPLTQEQVERQERWFHTLLALAEDLKLPLVLHIRGMLEEAIKILRQYKLEQSGVVHCVNFGWQYAKEYLDMGLYIGVGGSMTNANFPEFQETLTKTPLDRILMETDAPYVKPAWHTEQLNTSLTIPRMVSELAALRNVPAELVEQKTTENTERLFKI